MPETSVRIIGTFFSLQSVQARFSTLIIEFESKILIFKQY